MVWVHPQVFAPEVQGEVGQQYRAIAERCGFSLSTASHLRWIPIGEGLVSYLRPQPGPGRST